MKKFRIVKALIVFQIHYFKGTRQVPSCPYGLCDVVSQRPKGAYSARLVGQNMYREIERETVGTVSNIEKKWTPEYR